MDDPTNGPSADVETLEGHVDAALRHATDESTRFHLRHAKQLLLHPECEAGPDEPDGTGRARPASPD